MLDTNQNTRGVMSDLGAREVLQITDEVTETQQHQLQPTPISVLSKRRLSAELNYDLMIMVLARLPLDALFRIKSVRKSWVSIFEDARFLKARTRLPNQAPCFVLEGEEGFTAYIPESKKWMVFPYTFILGRVPSQDQMQVVQASCSGIVLLQDVDGVGDLNQPLPLHLYNPINKSRKLLPPTLSPEHNFCHPRIFFLQEDYKGCYKILAFCSRWFFRRQQRYSPRLQIYDTTSNTWEICKSNFVGLSGKTFLVQTVVVVGSLIYALVRIGSPEIVLSPTPNLFQLFFLSKDGWHVLALRMPPRMIDAHLFEHGGELMIIGTFQGPNNCTNEFSICVWEFQASNATQYRWSQVKRMPVELTKNIFDNGSIRVAPWLSSSISYGGYIYLGFETNPWPKIIMYDFVGDVWEILPDCKVPHKITPWEDTWTGRNFRGFLYQTKFGVVL